MQNFIYSIETIIPYYPVNDEKNGALYQRYKNLQIRKVIFVACLGEYRYYDMDAVIVAALELCEREIHCF